MLRRNFSADRGRQPRASLAARPNSLIPDYAVMTQPVLTRLTVLDLVPFGNVGGNVDGGAPPKEGCFALRLSPPAWSGWSPGQFVMIRPVEGDPSVLWARPFSICRSTERDLVLFFQVRGRVTSRMATLAPGDELDVWGPLGNTLAMEAKTPTLLLAGGIGIAPFVGYAHAHPTPWELTLEFGHRLPLSFYPFDGLNEKVMADAHREQSPEDLAAFLALVERRVAAHAEAKGLVLACGPTPFLRAVQTFAFRHGARAQLCLETRMACGIGACLGCVVKSTVPASVLAQCQAQSWDRAPELLVSAPAASPSKKKPAAVASASPHGGECEEHFVQTCTCGPNFWAHTVSI